MKREYNTPFVETIPYVEGARKASIVCTRCGTQTWDVPRHENGRPSWPCRPCRRETQHERDMVRREPRLCAVAKCDRRLRWHGVRFCSDHKPRFG